MGVKKQRREKHLNRLKQRRQKEVALEERLNFTEPFFTRYRVEINLFLIIAAIVFLIFHFLVKQDGSQAKRLDAAIPEEQKLQWAQDFPEGFRAFVVTDDQVVVLKDNSLPRELHLDWDKVTRVKSDAPGELRLRFSDIGWGNSGSKFEFTFVMDRHPGGASFMNLAPGVQLVTDIISDDNNGIVCLLGLKRT